MKLKAMKKVFALVLACMMLIPVLAGFGSFAAEAPTASIVSNNVWYGETLNLMYAVKTENADGYEVKLDVTVNGEAVDVYFDGEKEVKGELCNTYIVKKGVAAQNIDTVYTATVSLVKGDEVISGNTTTYSVLEYLNERLYVSEGVTTAQKEMYRALIDHAGKADILLNKDEAGIATLTYVSIEGVAKMYTVGKELTLSTDKTATEGNKLVWNVYDGEGNYVEMIENGEIYTVGKDAAIIVLAEVADGAQTPVELAVFNLGADGSASHNDGSGKTSYSETVDGITLSITSGTNMYTGARDAKGNSCLKFGSSKAVGSCKFEVPANVTKVIIAVAKYKANTTKVSVNGTTHTLTKNSNDGQYDLIEIDTTSVRTITFATVSGGVRAMMNTITFIGYAQ